MLSRYVHVSVAILVAARAGPEMVNFVHPKIDIKEPLAHHCSNLVLIGFGVKKKRS